MGCAGEEQQWGEQRTIPAFAEHEVGLILGKTSGRGGTNSLWKEISLGGIQPSFLTAQSCLFHGITRDVIQGGTRWHFPRMPLPSIVARGVM